MVNGVKVVVIFAMDNSSSVYTDNKKSILILGEDPADGLNDTTMTAEATYSVNITKSRKNICFSLHYIAGSSFLYAKGTRIYQLKAKANIVFGEHFKRFYT